MGSPAMADLRRITARLRGVQHGPISRLISPDGWGEQLKPFIFLDFFNAEIEPGFGFAMHPHSGIATLTWQPGSDVKYQDTTGKNGVLKAGGLEWMNSGGGAWHQGSLLGRGEVTGFQLWLPMPPQVEDGPAFGQYVGPEDVPVVEVEGGRLQVLLGSLDQDGAAVGSPIVSHHDLNYIAVELQAHAQWRYDPPANHDVAWAFGFEAGGQIQGADLGGDLVVLGDEGAILLSACNRPTKILIGTARRHDHPLVLSTHSVHTNEASLKEGARRIDAIGRSLQSPAC